MSYRDLEAQLLSSLSDSLAADGLDIEDLTVRLAGRRRLVRLLVDSDAGVSLDKVAELSKSISAELDRTNLMGEQPYVLEVSSPGIERPLALPRHWRRNTGRQVRVHFSDDREPLLGRIVSSDDSNVTLAGPDGPVVVPYDEVAKAIVQVDFKGDRRSPDGASTEGAPNEDSENA